MITHYQQLLRIIIKPDQEVLNQLSTVIIKHYHKLLKTMIKHYQQVLRTVIKHYQEVLKRN